MVRNIFTFVFVVAVATGVLSTPVKRCPPGLNCGVGPECTVYDCDVEDCASAPVCQKRDFAFLTKRCPPGLNCGVGPECTVDDCGVEDCASAPVCQKRGLASLTKRCPPGLNCGVGPECTVDDCGVEDCASAPVCQKRGFELAAEKVKRDPTLVVHPCPDICNEDGVCGCALESLIAHPSMVKRDPTPVDQKVCPQICNEEGVCGCALESSITKPSVIKRDPTPVNCPDHCDTDDNCGCPKIPVVTMKS